MSQFVKFLEVTSLCLPDPMTGLRPCNTGGECGRCKEQWVHNAFRKWVASKEIIQEGE